MRFPGRSIMLKVIKIDNPLYLMEAVISRYARWQNPFGRFFGNNPEPLPRIYRRTSLRFRWRH